MKRLGFHTLRDKATDTLGDKLSRQLQEDVAPKMSDEEAPSGPLPCGISCCGSNRANSGIGLLYRIQRNLLQSLWCIDCG